MIPIKNIRRFFHKGFRQPFYAVGVFKKRLSAHLGRKFLSGRSFSPEAITLFLTRNCNLRCHMCGQWGDRGITRKQGVQVTDSELSLKNWLVLIEDVSRFKPSITLFGGEPLLNSGCLEIIRAVKHKKMHCLMITNGSLLEASAEDIVKSGLDELNVSLDAGQSLHDEIRGMPGLFERIIKGLQKVQSLKNELHSKKPLLNLQCTISKYNYKHLEQLLEVAEELKANSLTFHNLIFLNREIVNKQKEYDSRLNCTSVDWEGFVFAPEIDPQYLQGKIQDMLSRKHSFSVDFYPNFSYSSLKDYYENPYYRPTEYSGRCLSSWLAAYVFPEGEVRPCLNLSYSFGNIKEKPFLLVWNSPEAIKFRRLLKKDCFMPACVRCTELYRY